MINTLFFSFVNFFVLFSLALVLRQKKTPMPKKKAPHSVPAEASVSVVPEKD